MRLLPSKSVDALFVNTWLKRTSVRLWELSNHATGTPEYREAQKLQNELALVDGFMQKIGVGALLLLNSRFITNWTLNSLRE